jgi:hypothetical protein
MILVCPFEQRRVLAGEIVGVAAIQSAEILNKGDYSMHRTNRLIASAVLAAASLAPVAMTVAAGPQVGVSIRVYDRKHKDYHNWDDRENRSWGIFLTTNHRREHEFRRASRREQEEYWEWRHHHPDRD